MFMFLKVSYAMPGCIYLIKNAIKDCKAAFLKSHLILQKSFFCNMLRFDAQETFIIIINVENNRTI